MKATLLFFGLFITYTSFAQQHTFYKNSKGIYTEAQLDSMLNTMQEKLNAQGLDYLTAVKEITGESRNGDTLFYSFKTKGVNLDAKIAERKNTIIGKPLPQFSFTDINGNKVASEDFKGRAMVINLWFTTCPPCIKEMPDLNNMKKQHPDIAFLSMTYEEKAKVAEFLRKTPFHFQHISDVKEYVEKLQFGYPTTLFIDKNGVVQELTHGASLTGLNISEFNKAIEKIK